MNDTLNFNTKAIITNQVHPKATHVVNTIVLLVKQYIYHIRCQRKELSVENVTKEIYMMHSYELYFAKAKQRLHKHRIKWYPLISQREETNVQSVINDNFINNYM